MIANVNKTNNGKLLAAVIATLMIVCAIAVVASPSEAAVDAKPTYDFTGDTTVEVDAVSDLTAEIGYDSKSGVLTVTEDLVLDISETVGSSTAPAIKQIVLNGGNLQITGTGVIYVGTDATQDNVSVISFQQASVLEITGAVDVNLNAAGTNCHILNNGTSAVTVLVTVSNGADLTITQTGSKGASWYNSDSKATSETYLDVDNATVNLTNAHSIQGAVVKATNGANINVDNERDVTGITLKDGSVIDDSKITVTKSGYSGVLVKGTVELNNSASIEVKESGVYGKDNEYPGINMSNMTWGNVTVTPAIVMDDTSSVTTTSIGVCDENSSETLANGTATITGGTFTGAIAQGNNSTAVTYTLNTTLAGTTTLAAGATIGADSYVTVTGTFTAEEKSTVTGTVFATSTAKVNVPSTTTATNIVAAPGAEITGITISEENEGKYTATTAEGLIAAAAIPGMDITIGHGTSTDYIITLTENLVIADGTTVSMTNSTSADSIKIDENITITKVGSGNVNMKVINGTSNLYEINLNGEFTVKQGSVWVDGAKLTGDNNVITTRGGDLRITGDLNGTLKIVTGNLYQNDQPVIYFDDFTVNAGATLQLATDKDGVTPTYYTRGDFNLYGNLIADGNVELIVGYKNTGSGSTEVDNSSKFTAYPGAVISQYVNVMMGENDKSSINLDDSLKNMEISIDITGHQVYSQMQNVTIVTSLDITPYASLTIMGKLIVNEGVVLTIQENAELIIDSSTAQMIVNGTITVEGDGKITVRDADNVDVAGAINSDGAVYINSKVTVEEGGSILVDDSEGSILAVAEGLTVNAGGSVEVRGEMAVANITNKGTVTLNGATLTSASVEGTSVTTCKISMAANGAVVDIKSFISETSANTLSITDMGLVLYEKKTDKIVVGDANYPTANMITLSGDDMLGLKGLTVTESVTSEKDENNDTIYHYGMDIAGSVGIVDEREEPTNGTSLPVATYGIGVSGVKIDVVADTTLTLGAGVTLTNKGELNVDGIVYAIAGNETNKNQSKIDNMETINVTGMIETIVEIASGINAAHYEADVEGVAHNYYTTLAAAIANGADEIYIMGDIEIMENLTIPTGITVRADGAATIQIGDADHRDVVVTVTAGATVRGFTGGINVDATLEFQDIKDSKSGNVITSDVQVDAEPARTYTNVYTALNGAESGETVTITRDGTPVELTDDIEIKTGVTLSVPNSRSIQVNNGVTLTVNGTLLLVGEIVGEVAGEDSFNPMIDADTQKDADDYATILVNGTIKSMDALRYTSDIVNGTITELGYYIAGAYYNIVDSTGDYEYITPVTQAAAVSNNVYEGAIAIYGDNTVADIAFTGDENDEVVVTLMDNSTLAAGTITLNYAAIDADAAGCGFSGTIASAVGSIAFVNATNFVVIDAYNSDDAEYIAVSGTPAQADKDGADCTVTIASGNVTVAASTVLNIKNSTLETFEIASGATMTVLGTLQAQDMTVNGTLVSTDGGYVDVDGILTVRGTFTVTATDETAGTNAGKADIYELFVGIATNDDLAFVYGDSSAAAVNADNLGNNLVRVVVSADSTIAGELTKNMNSTEFYVEDVLAFTVYVVSSYNDTGSYISGYYPGELQEAMLKDFTEGKGWANADGKAANAEKIGAPTFDKVYAQINYDVYNVIVYIDNGIGDVAIDGQLLVANDSGGYVLPGNAKLDAGQHTITYTLKPNYEGTPTLSATGDNATVSGLTFTLSGDFATYDGEGIVWNMTTLTLSGTAPADTTVVIDGGSGDDGMSLTDILLIVLVVLILVMAIIVALRLMRS